MIWFYRDFLDGFVYIIVAILSLIFIMAIIGFILERKKNEEEEKNRIAVLSSDMNTVNNQVPPAVENLSSVNTVQTNAPTVAPAVSGQSVIPPQVIEKSQNAATNDKIPEILDFDKIEAEQAVKTSVSSQNQL